MTTALPLSRDGLHIRLPPSVAFNTARVYLDTVLLMPPHRPLSEEIATATLLSTSAPAGAEPHSAVTHL